ncbi:hypothetical protein SAMN05192534_10543 [Alteribacillus persepolensis]|uniref:Uncharacterized protein n=1 Tax=Alteribacillus persepolensis TaxID=568899 RepID=A0A1G8C2N3_9BACI|nr:hypothetical protein [Alteribacillus persepolensis]SDH39746.1 hypothetical protein SAMN05192534_10543 [Alteribacillus persepolensis]
MKKKRVMVSILIGCIIGFGVTSGAHAFNHHSAAGYTWFLSSIKSTVEHANSYHENADHFDMMMNTAEGSVSLNSNGSKLAEDIETLFNSEGINNHLHDYNPEELVIRVSDPNVLSFDKAEAKQKMAISKDPVQEAVVEAYAQQEGAAHLYLDAVEEGEITTLAKTEIEVKK